MSADRVPARRGSVVALIAALVACLVYNQSLDWAAPGEEMIPLVFGSRAELGRLLPALAESKDGVTYQPHDPGVPPVAWARLDAGGRQVSSHVLLQMRGYLLKTRTYDESKTFNALAALDPRSFRPEIFIYGGSYLASVAAAFGVTDRIGLASLVNDRGYYLEHPDELRRLYVAARVVSSAAAVALVALCTLAAAQAGIVAAVVAATLLCLSPEMLAASHIAKPHGLAVALVIGAFLAGFGARRPRPLVGGVLAGLGMGASLPYAALVVLLGGMVFVRQGRRPALVLLATAAITFLLTNPHVVIYPDRLLATVGSHTHDYGYGVLSFGRLATFVADLGTLGLGWGGVALAAVGALSRQGRTRGWALMMLVGVLLGAAFGALRIAMVVVPVGAVLAGFGAQRIAEAMRVAPMRAAAVVLLVALQVPTWWAFASLSVAYAAEADPARSPMLQAGRWINEHVPEGAEIAFGDSSGWTDDVPPFQFLRYSLSALTGPGPEYAIVTGKCDAVVETKAAALGLGGYVEAARFDACAGRGTFALCNCRYQSGLSISLLRRSEHAARPAQAPDGHLDTGLRG